MPIDNGRSLMFGEGDIPESLRDIMKVSTPFYNRLIDDAKWGADIIRSDKDVSQELLRCEEKEKIATAAKYHESAAYYRGRIAAIQWLIKED